MDQKPKPKTQDETFMMLDLVMTSCIWHQNAQATKEEKRVELDFLKIKNVRTSKDTPDQQSAKTTDRMWENNCKSSIW